MGGFDGFQYEEGIRLGRGSDQEGSGRKKIPCFMSTIDYTSEEVFSVIRLVTEFSLQN